MRALIIVAILASTASADVSAEERTETTAPDPFAASRGPVHPIEEQPAFEPAQVDLRVENDPAAVTYRDTFHRRKSRVALGVGMMVAGVASLWLIGPLGLGVIGAGFAVTVTAPLDRERTLVPPSRTQVGLAFSGRF